MAQDEFVAAAKGGIVVGMDDSPSARVALARAIEEASLRGVGVLALAVYSSPSPWAPQVSKVLDDERVRGTVQAAAKRVVDDVVAEQRARGFEAISVVAGIRSGSPTDELCRISRDSVMLVIGDRGRGELASRLVGSVTLGVVLHASCPVLVVHAEDR